MKVKELIELLNSYNLEDEVKVRLDLLDGAEVYDFPINETYILTDTVVLEIIERDSTRNYREIKRRDKMKELTVDELWDKLLERELFTKEELQLITNINGYSIETLNDAIYARYGYRDYNQMKEYL